jgi:ABC-type dipeptide/oligopeptide/nickel transport system permease component
VVLLRHACNAQIPIVTVVGIDAGFAQQVVVVETIFSLREWWRLALDSVAMRDYLWCGVVCWWPPPSCS